MNQSETEGSYGTSGAIGVHMRANRNLHQKNIALERELRLAMEFIGMCPHHVFKYPKEVVDFWERNIAYAPHDSRLK